jgi:hypothetical protein
MGRDSLHSQQTQAVKDQLIEAFELNLSSRRRTDPGQAERDEMPAPQHPVPTGQENGQEHAKSAAASGATYRHDDPVPVSVLVNEASDAGVVDWLADQIRSQFMPHDWALDARGGLLPALAAAAHERIASRSASVQVIVTHDPTTGSMTVDSDARATLATIRDLCLEVAMVCDLHSVVEVRRDGAVVRCN